jgi:ATP-dependent HslUV protease subunit HslV
MLIVADAEHSLLVSGTGDVIETHDDLMAIGSGGPFAQSAARALFDSTELSARDIVEKSLEIAGDICIYTNHSRTIEEI